MSNCGIRMSTLPPVFNSIRRQTQKDKAEHSSPMLIEELNFIIEREREAIRSAYTLVVTLQKHTFCGEVTRERFDDQK